jgi:hypothetical protein
MVAVLHDWTTDSRRYLSHSSTYDYRWLPAAIWSVYALSQYKTDQKIKTALESRE